MIEQPEAINYMRQLKGTIMGKRIVHAAAACSSHKFTWYYGNPQEYNGRLKKKVVHEALAFGGMVEITAGDSVIVVTDGVGLRYHVNEQNRPQKHQLLIEFEDGSALSASVQMYGGIWCFHKGEFDSMYYRVAKEKPSPLSKDFNEEYFKGLLASVDKTKVSTKAFLATEQRIPGLGNGVLQDILWNAELHPRKKVDTLTDGDIEKLFNAVKGTLSEMAEHGGRDTEKDLFGNKGGYRTIMGKNNDAMICPHCGGHVRKENYMGGSIYFCEDCQK
ncbi:MAG: endonuclease VIII [Bacillota bacterium]|nr:endonuclease VIII [Bacillota bacterium]